MLFPAMKNFPKRF